MAKKITDEDEESMVQAKFYLPKRLHDGLRAYARREKLTMSVVLRELLTEALPD